MDVTTEQLIASCQSGNKRAQETLYERYAKQLYNTCFRITGKTSEAEEAMQDALLKVFTRSNQYQNGRDADSWIKGIAIHTAIDYVRRQEPEWDELSENETAPDEDETDEETILYSVAMIKKATERLPAGYRVILSLYLFEGYDMEEIASILKLRPSSVRSQYIRAKRKLLELMKIN